MEKNKKKVIAFSVFVCYSYPAAVWKTVKIYKKEKLPSS